MKLNIYVQPGAKKTMCDGLHGSHIKIRIKSPPLEGKANEELIEFLSEKLKVKKSCIGIVAGEKSRYKIVEIDGVNDLTEAYILQALEG